MYCCKFYLVKKEKSNSKIEFLTNLKLIKKIVVVITGDINNMLNFPDNETEACHWLIFFYNFNDYHFLKIEFLNINFANICKNIYVIFYIIILYTSKFILEK